MVSLKKQDAKSIFRDERDLAVAVKYMKQNGKQCEIKFYNSENVLFNIFTTFTPFLGTILYFDYPGLTDCYFIDPHWLYGLLCRVCTSPLLASCKIDSK